MGSGEGLAVGIAVGATGAAAVGLAVTVGWPDVGVGDATGVAQVLSLVGTGSGVADPAPPTVVALGTGVATAEGAAAVAEGTGVGTAVGQGSPLGTGSGVAGFPVGLAVALADTGALGAADAVGDAVALACAA